MRSHNSASNSRRRYALLSLLGAPLILGALALYFGLVDISGLFTEDQSKPQTIQPKVPPYSDVLAQQQQQAAAAAASQNRIEGEADFGPGRLTLKIVPYGDGDQVVAALEKTRVDGKYSAGGIMEREFVRQALLMALRDELGIATRDEALGETTALKSPEAKPVVDITIDYNPKSHRNILFGRPNDDGEPLLKFELGANGVPQFSSMASRMFMMATITLPEFLVEQGVPKTDFKPVWHDSAAAPEDTEELLAEMTMISYVRAIRALHQIMREDGESPERLGELIRAYANLGSMTEFLWTPAHKVYKARSLLYAQRMMSKTDSSALALRHRAYALALAGLHAEALADIDAAAAKEDAGEAPDWLHVAQAYCKFDMPALNEAREDHSTGRLAGMLYYIVNENPKTYGYSIAVGHEVLEQNPELFLVYDGISEIGGVSEGHMSTREGPIRLLFSLARLPEIPDIPEKVVRGLTRDQGALDEVTSAIRAVFGGEDDSSPLSLPSVFRALRHAENTETAPHEFSWSVLASLLSETHFVQTFRQAEFYRYQLSLPRNEVAEFAEAASNEVADHPYKDLIVAYGLRGDELTEMLARYESNVDYAHIEIPHEALVRRLQEECDRKLVRDWVLVAMANRDFAYNDMAAGMNVRGAQIAGPHLQVTFMLSPHSNLARSLLIEHFYEQVKNEVEKWEEEAADDPLILRALGNAYSQAGRTEDAIRVMEARMELSPDYGSYNILADLYKKQGKMDLWRQTLDRFIAEGRGGLSNDRARVEIAKYLMSQNKLDEAAEYADAAADSWAAWAMHCAAECAARQNNYEKAIMYRRRIVDRYPRDEYTLTYLRMSVYTKQFPEVVEYARPTVLRMAEEDATEDRSGVGVALILIDEQRKALDIFEHSIQHSENEPLKNYSSFFTAYLADRFDQTDVRDKAIVNLLDGSDETEAVVRDVARLIQKSLADPDKHPLDTGEVDKLLADARYDHRINLSYFVGMFLENWERSDEAQEFLEQLVKTPQAPRYSTNILTVRELTKRGVDWRPLREIANKAAETAANEGA